MKIFSLLLLMMQIFYISAQNYIPFPPGEIFPYEYKEYKSELNGYYFLTPFNLFKDVNHPEHIPAKPIILDKNGFLVWYMDVSQSAILFRFFPGQNKFGFATTVTPNVAYYKLLDHNLNIIDSFTNSPDAYADTHEFLITDNGNYIITGARDSIIDLSAFNFGGIQGSANTSIRAYVIEEFDQTFNRIFYWNSNDHIHPTEAYESAYGGYDSTDFDYCHGNALEVDTDGNFLVSFRHLNSIYKVNRNGGSVMWRLGGKSSDFTFINDTGFSGQHDIRRLGNGNISLYDNGNMAPAPKASRGVEYILDTVNWTATMVREFIYTPPFYAFAMGNYQVTPSDLRLINYGFTFRPNPSITVFDDNNDLVADIFFADSVMNYRGFLFDFPFPLSRPSITCSLENGVQKLSVPSGFNRYIWSTGETTKDILIAAPGIYQVWVESSSGMIGSYPVKINTIAEGCITVGINEKRSASMKITEIYDMLGRTMSSPETGKVYIIKYENGSVEKLIWQETLEQIVIW